MKIKKIIICLLILILINGIFSLNIANASVVSDIKDSADNFLNSGDDTQIFDEETLKQTSDEIYNILLGIGIIVAVIVGAFLGIHFIMESAEGKAKVAEALVPYVVGCIVVFGAFTIWKVAINIGNDIDPYVEITGEYATDAVDYIENGGDLTKVPDDTLISWYGQLARQAGNNERFVDEYKKVCEEVDRRGGYEELSKNVHSESSSSTVHESSSGTEHGGSGRKF